MSVVHMRRGPLSGYRVVDLSSVVMGPLASQILADLGADVIAVERPGGDPNRYMSDGPHPELSGQALNLLRGKRSIALDLTHTRGREVFDRLLGTSDVFLTNLRPASRERARLTEHDLGALRPDLIYCAATGFGPEDPRADDPAYDDIIQSASGAVDIQRLAGLGDTYMPTVLVDKVCGMAIAHAITAALLDRERTGEGAVLHIAMYEVMAAFLLVEHGGPAIPEPPIGSPGNARMLNASRRPIATQDGLVGVLVYELHQFESLVHAVGRDDLVGDPRFATRAGRLRHLDEIYTICAEIAAGMTTREFLSMCRRSDVPAHPVASLDEVVAALPTAHHPHAGDYRRTPSLAPGRTTHISAGSPAPLIGQHTADVLTELGYTAAESQALFARGAAGGTRHN